MSKIFDIVLIFLIPLKLEKLCDRFIFGNTAIAHVCLLLLYCLVFL